MATVNQLNGNCVHSTSVVLQQKFWRLLSLAFVIFVTEWLNLKPWLASNFTLHCYFMIDHKIFENEQNDQQRWNALMIEQILPTYTTGHMRSLVRRIFILVQGLKGLIALMSVPSYNCFFLFCLFLFLQSCNDQPTRLGSFIFLSSVRLTLFYFSQ